MFNTTCEEGIVKSEVHTCVMGSGVSDVEVEHKCVGIREILEILVVHQLLKHHSAK